MKRNSQKAKTYIINAQKASKPYKIGKTNVISSQNKGGENKKKKYIYNTQIGGQFSSQKQNNTYGFQEKESNSMGKTQIKSNNQFISNPFVQPAQPQNFINPLKESKKEKGYNPYSTILRIEKPYNDISHDYLNKK